MKEDELMEASIKQTMKEMMEKTMNEWLDRGIDEFKETLKKLDQDTKNADVQWKN